MTTCAQEFENSLGKTATPFLKAKENKTKEREKEKKRNIIYFSRKCDF